MAQPFPHTSAAELPVSKLPADMAAPLRPHLTAAVEEMVREIENLVPEYARPPESPYGQRMRRQIRQAVQHFVDAIGNPDQDLDAVVTIFEGIGRYEARLGRGLDGLQTAIRVSGQVACRRFIRDARRLDWPLDVLGHITESLFMFLEKIAEAAARGYAGARGEPTGERERSRRRLRDLLVADPPASREALAELARSACWTPSRTLAAVAVRTPPEFTPPVLPPSVLADWHAPAPYLIVPDPDGPGQDRLISTLVRDCQAAIGPTVPPTKGALSLRWARHALDLVERGVLPGKEAVRCLDHLPTLVADRSAELIDVALRHRLAPLVALPRHKRDPLVKTLLTYMENRDNAVAAADRLLVHEQTVRYRIRRLEQMLGELVYDADRRIELLLLLHAWVHIRPAAETAAS
ncbi:Fis family transcriptional regulator [Actinomadura sp. NBRC 104425]|uniref:PucR family transcriptional regulator n=1 Tax=Actinomadura sp. NBRC 104425 TaxID=3032204 RepID=UPI0024A02B34|nr:helix-turn-helix domain-containing protein [Actinomadura sp. NBRC 104425]GLZ16190.1 Fis family transcriptional regulator [Actinomadura sp. NBRC 104425]